MPHGKYPILNNAYQQLNASSPTHWHIAPPPSMLICIPSPWSGTWWTYRHHSWATGGCLWLQERIKITKLTHNITYHVLWVELTLICNTSSDRKLELGRSGSTRLSQNVTASVSMQSTTSDIGDATNDWEETGRCGLEAISTEMAARQTPHCHHLVCTSLDSCKKKRGALFHNTIHLPRYTRPCT